MAAEPLFQRQKSELACEPCKRRKTKCDRELPACRPCSKNAYSCVYPSKRLKPGPKIGSHPRVRRRRRGPSRNDLHRSPHRSAHGEAMSRDDDINSTVDLWTGPSSRIPAHFIEAGPDYLASLSSSSKLTDKDDDAMELSVSSDVAATNFIRAISFSSLIHPTHKRRDQVIAETIHVFPDSVFISMARSQSLIMQACETLRVTVPHLQSLTDLYFDNMTAISLFHRPSFGSKIQGIKDQASLTALLASMFSFSVRFFLDVESTTNAQDMPSSKQFHQMALDQIDEILKGMEEDAPPLVVLQAMTLCGYNQLIGGVHGKGWRLVGSCVRIAYELRLHLIDYEAPIFTSDDAGYTHKWVAKEEQRRCWWAIWEMDVFASTVRRSPLAIDWTMNETYLPVDDELWFKNQHCQSCFLDPQPGERWKKLNKSGNKSPSAWLIVLSSIMRDAQSLSRGNLQGVRSEDNGTDQVAELQQYFRNVFRKKSPAADEQQPSFLGHALRSTVSTLPESLAYKGEALSFGSDDITPEPSSFKRPRGFWDAARYSIFLTIQLARFQIFHHYAFSEIASGTLFTENPVDPPFGWTVTRSSLQGSMRNCEGLRNCLEAADDIHAILTNVPEEHVKWVNPFLSSTVWLAASLQVLRKVYSLGTDTENESKFALLRLTCQRYQAFWGTPLTLISNIDCLESHLIHKRRIAAGMEARCNTKHHSPKPQLDRSSRECGEGEPGDLDMGVGFSDDPTSDVWRWQDSSVSLGDIDSIQTFLDAVPGFDTADLSAAFSTMPFLDMMPDGQSGLDECSVEYSPGCLNQSLYTNLDAADG